MLKKFEALRKEVEQLSASPQIQSKQKVLVIRLDDIGDYILFRNTVSWFTQSDRFKNSEFTLLGNQAWKEIFTQFDNDVFQEALWLNKKEYYNNPEEQSNFWKSLRAAEFQTVICASRTRLLLLDDLCALATNALIKIACENTYPNPEINQISNSIYTELFPHQPALHEFFFNQAFANWYLQTQFQVIRPVLQYPFTEPDIQRPYLMCCIGAAHKSKRWPVKNWVLFIQQCLKETPYSIVLSGSGAETTIAAEIESQVSVINLVGRTTQIEFINYMKFAVASVCQDSMAAHVSVACKTPAIIIANGNNASRFTTYEEAGISGVKTIYPKQFLRSLVNKPTTHFWHYTPVSKDIATIQPQQVFETLKVLINK